MHGRGYEDLIRYVYEQLSHLNGKEIDVKRNVKIKGKSGVLHQIDVFYEFELNDIVHRVAIECKDHNRPITKGDVQEFKAKLDDIPNSTGLMASKKGYQSGAKEYAAHYDIEMISGGEMPMLSKVSAKRIEVLLPNEKVVGQPFWIIMEEYNGEVTGTYMTIEEKTIGLFLSKKMAQKMADKIGGVVRGLSQKHLKATLEFAKHFDLKFYMFIFDEITAIQPPIKDIEELFVYE